MTTPLSREEVENLCDVLGEVSIDWPVRISLSRSIRCHDAAMRQQLAQVTQERNDLQAESTVIQELIQELQQRLADSEARVKELERS